MRKCSVSKFRLYRRSSVLLSTFPFHQSHPRTHNLADSRSFLPQLSSVVQSGIQVVVWAGDADWLCNWFGNLAASNAVTYAGSAAFNAASLTSYTVGGAAAGTFKTVKNLSFLRVFAAGHELPYYQPAAALQVFKQTMQQQPLSST